jgi:cation diffusion facilitator CzcD-associated flavoprotein CzcO
MKRTAPEKYWDALTPDFELSTKRRVIDYGYLAATNSPKFDLIQGDSIADAEGHTVTTTSGREVPADVVIMSTGFKVSDLLAPLVVTNEEGENLVEKLKGNGYKAYRGTVVSGKLFPLR